jgi:hypothetical protein
MQAEYQFDDAKVRPKRFTPRAARAAAGRNPGTVQLAALRVFAGDAHCAQQYRLLMPLWISMHTPSVSQSWAIFISGVIPRTSYLPRRLMSEAPRTIHSARVCSLPSAVSGPTMAIDSSLASQTYADMLCSSIGSSSQ